MILILTRGMIKQTPLIWERHPELWPRPVQAVLHVAQAIAESLVFGNLGLDVVTTPFQAVILVLGLASLWSWSRGGPGRINPLEAAGATIVVGSYFLVYFFRGNLAFSSLRPVVWYNAIPQIGAVLFAAGWWAGLRPADPRPMTRLSALVVSALVVTTALIQAPRVERYFIAKMPPMTPTEAKLFLDPSRPARPRPIPQCSCTAINRFAPWPGSTRSGRWPCGRRSDGRAFTTHLAVSRFRASKPKQVFPTRSIYSPSLEMAGPYLPRRWPLATHSTTSYVLNQNSAPTG